MIDADMGLRWTGAGIQGRNEPRRTENAYHGIVHVLSPRARATAAKIRVVSSIQRWSFYIRLAYARLRQAVSPIDSQAA